MLRWLRRLFTWVVFLIALWLALLAVAGEVGGRWVAKHMRTEMGDTWGATVRVGGVDLGPVRGQAEIVELGVERSGLGAMRLTVHQAVLEAAPLGLALLHRDRADLLRLRGVRAELSSWAVLAPPPGRELAFRLRRVEVEDLELLLAPTLLFPQAGAVTLRVDRAVTGPVTLRSAASWVLALRNLDAKAAFPGGEVEVSLRVGRGGRGTLTLRSALVGGELAVPLELPAPGSLSDARAELAALGKVATQVARELGGRKARQALERMLR